MKGIRNTRKAFRETEASRLSHALNKAIKDSGMTREGVAEACGLAITTVSNWCNPEMSHHAKPQDIALFPPLLRHLFLREVVGEELTVCESLDAGEGALDLEWLHRALKEGTDFHVAYSGALADGVFTGPEIGKCLAEVREAIAVYTSIERALVKANEAAKCAPLRVAGGTK